MLNIYNSSISRLYPTSAMHQIAKNIRNSLSYSQLLERIKEWNVQFRLKEKYYSWSLKSPHPKIKPKFYQLVEQTIITYTLKNFAWILNDFQQHLVGVHLKNMKAVYSSMSLGSSISSQAFNFSMIILVKLTAYFLSNHISVIQVDMILECDIYRQAMFNILGIQIEKNTYQIILRMYKSKKEISKERQSLTLQKDDKENSNTSLQSLSKLQTIKSIGRRNGKHQTYLNHIADLQDQRSRLQEIKYLLKSNLYVKPNLKKAQAKYTISQLKQKQNQSIINRQYSSLASKVGHYKNKSMQTPKGKFIIQSNQLSDAFSCNYEVKLNEIKKHSIHLSHNKNLHIHIKPKELKKLQIKRTQSKIKDKEGVNSVKNWIKIVTEMKQELYTHSKSNRISQNNSPSGQIEDSYNQIQPLRKVKNSQEQGETNKSQKINEQTIKFRKLNLMNSPNVIVYDDYPLGSEEPVLAKSEYLKPQVKLSRTHSKKKKERIVDPHKSNE